VQRRLSWSIPARRTRPQRLSAINLLECLIQFEIRHSISGRIRLRIPALKNNQALEEMLTHWLGEQPGVFGARVNRACCSVVINYSAITDQPLPWLKTLARITPQQLRPRKAVPARTSDPKQARSQWILASPLAFA